MVSFVLFVDLDDLRMMYGDTQIQEVSIIFQEMACHKGVNLYERNEFIFKVVAL